MSGAGQALERQRQRLLLQALWQRRPDADLAAWLREDGARLGAGIAAYRTNAAATACRALAAAYPVLAELVAAQAPNRVAIVSSKRPLSEPS